MMNSSEGVRQAMDVAHEDRNPLEALISGRVNPCELLTYIESIENQLDQIRLALGFGSVGTPTPRPTPTEAARDD